MTQQLLAEKVGLAGQAHIAYVESGHDEASLDLVIRFAYVFGVTTDYLVRDTVPAENVTNAPELEHTEIPAALLQLFGAKLHSLRLHYRMSQTDLARQLKLTSRAYISNLEAGRKKPSLNLVVQLASLFAVTADYLLLDVIPIVATNINKSIE